MKRSKITRLTIHKENETLFVRRRGNEIWLYSGVRRLLEILLSFQGETTLPAKAEIRLVFTSYPRTPAVRLRTNMLYNAVLGTIYPSTSEIACCQRDFESFTGFRVGDEMYVSATCIRKTTKKRRKHG